MDHVLYGIGLFFFTVGVGDIACAALRNRRERRADERAAAMGRHPAGKALRA